MLATQSNDAVDVTLSADEAAALRGRLDLLARDAKAWLAASDAPAVLIFDEAGEYLYGLERKGRAA